MNHTIQSKESLGNNHWFIEIELMPENDIEIKAIQHIEIGGATDEELDFVEKYLDEALGTMSIVNLVRQKGNVFALTTTM